MTTQPKHLTVAEKIILQVASPELYALEIAEAAKVTKTYVNRTVKKFNLEIRRPNEKLLTESQKEEIREMASPRIGAAGISKKIKSSIAQVRYFMDKEGLPRKTNTRKRTYQKNSSSVFRWEDFENRVI